MQYGLVDKIVDRLLIFLLVMSSGGMLFVLNRNIASIIFFVLLFLVVSFFGKPLKLNIFSSAVVTFILLALLGVINYSFAANEQSLNKYGFHLLTVTLTILTIVHFKNNRTTDLFLDGIYFVLKIILFHSIINFFLFFLVKNNLSVVGSIYHDYDTFLNIFFYSSEKGVVNIFGLEICRNQGLFWEPGVLQGFLNILFFIEAFILKRSRTVLITTALIILSTYSTTGLALLFIQIIYFMKSEFKLNIATFLVVLICIPLYFLFTVNMNEKIYGDRESSFQKRLFDLTQPLFIALEHPLSGTGLDIEQFQNLRSEFYFNSNTLRNLQQKMGIQSKVSATDRGSSNSIMFLFASMGFPTAILFLLLLFNQNIINKHKNFFILIILLVVMSEPLLLRPFFFMLITSGLFRFVFKIISFKEKLV